MTPEGKAQSNISPISQDIEVIAWCGDALFGCCSVKTLLQIVIRKLRRRQDRKSTYNIILRRVRVTIFAVENPYYIRSVGLLP